MIWEHIIFQRALTDRFTSLQTEWDVGRTLLSNIEMCPCISILSIQFVFVDELTQHQVYFSENAAQQILLSSKKQININE